MPDRPPGLSRRAVRRRLSGAGLAAAATAVAPLTTAAQSAPGPGHSHAQLIRQLFAVLNGAPPGTLDDFI